MRLIINFIHPTLKSELDEGFRFFPSKLFQFPAYDLDGRMDKIKLI